MLINYVPGEECRIAIVEDGKLEEFYQERASSESHVSNIYKGRVTNTEPAIQAAFVDFGLERNGFLHISDLHPKYFNGKDREEFEKVGHKTAHRDRPPIQKCLRRGDEVLVQVLKEGIGTKGPTLTSYLSIPGRFLVMMPDMQRLGVSRKIEDEDQRKELRDILKELDPPEQFGFIIRTAGIGQTKAELKRDLAYLQRLWKNIESKRKKARKTGELYAESDLVIRTIRDVFSKEVGRIVVDDPGAARRAHDFLAVANPRARSKVVYYDDPIPLLSRFHIEDQVDAIHAREVPLPSGGSLVIDPTEALVAIDVNSGKSRDARDAESNAYNTNQEAVDEICRQLRLRDLGGVVVNDLIDMRHAKHRKSIEQRFRNNLKNDRARTRISAISQFGILEMTRQRMRPSLTSSLYNACHHCQGSGYAKSAESVLLSVMRQLAVVMHRRDVARVELTISPDVAFLLLNSKRHKLVELEQRHDKRVLVRVGGGRIDFVEISAFNAQGGALTTDAPTNHKHLPQPGDDAYREIDQLPAAQAPEDEAEAEDEAETEAGAGDQGRAEEADEAKAEADAAREAGVQGKRGEAGEDEKSEGGRGHAADDGEGQGAKALKKRRRRRRGGRGRRKNKDASAADSPSQDGDASAPDHAEETTAAPAPEAQAEKTAKGISNGASEDASEGDSEETSEETSGGDSGGRKRSGRRRRDGRGRKSKAAKVRAQADAEGRAGGEDPRDSADANLRSESQAQSGGKSGGGSGEKSGPESGGESGGESEASSATPSRGYSNRLLTPHAQPTDA